MKINLIRDRNVDQEVYAQVVDLLQSTPGAIQFKGELETEEEPRIQFSISENRLADFSENNEDDQKYKAKPEEEIAPKLEHKFRFSWRSLFKRSEKVRISASIPEEEASYLITDKENELNYFSAFDVNQPSNGFIQASDWDLFIDSPAAYPIAYEVIATF